jgi:hypothetical protein
MATELSWVTPIGTIANFPIGAPSITQLIVADNKNTGATISYTKISGDLPPGMTLNSDGTITGTPQYSTASNNYFTNLNYTFIARARTSDNRVLDGSFTVVITNTVNQDFTWVTPAGNLGTVPNGQFYSLRLEADSTNNFGITYSLVSGELPPGMQLVSHQVDKTVRVAQAFVGASLLLSNIQTISVNDFVFGDKIPLNTRVVSINPVTKTVVLSNSTTSAVQIGETVKFYSIGLLQGVPTILDPIAVDESRSYRFTIRATNSLGRIVDRAFSLSVTNIYGPIIQPETKLLGSFFDGIYFSQQLEVAQLNPVVEIQWSIVDGKLPAGISLDQNGLLAGYVTPIELSGEFGADGYDGVDLADGVVTNQGQYDRGPYQFNQINSSIGYTFTVQAFDGANYDLQTYQINFIASRTGWTADNDIVTVDDSYLTIDSANVYYPFIRNTVSTLPAGRQNSYYAAKIDGYDWDNGTENLSYRIVNTLGTYDGSLFDPLDRNDLNNGLPGSFDLVTATTSNLPGVELDETSGWIYGLLDEQSTAIEEYTFGIQVCKTVANVEYCSVPKYFTLPVIGDPNSAVTWITESNLGTVDNGSISEIYLEASSASGKDLTYRLADRVGVSCRMPQGLKLLPSGEISGRVTFEAFTVDDYTTTFDNAQLTVDRTTTFTVIAETIDETSSAERTFTLTLNVIDEEPYENLYLSAMPTLEQRKIYNSLISDTTIFDPASIYRPTDPYYGIQQDLTMLFLPGLSASQLTRYQEAMIQNHYTKTYTFGKVKTAYVLDSIYSVKYEVVYVEIVDPGELTTVDLVTGRRGPPLEVDLTNTISNPYIDRNGNEFTIVYPNSSENMRMQLEDIIGYQDQSSLPPWMISNQPDSASVTGFTIPLGYTKAVVIAYANPGEGEKIAYRIRETGLDFNRIEFTVDRYQLDNYYSSNYDTTELTYIADRETTFDSDTNINVGSVVASVTYAVEVPYSQINGRPVNYINNNGGIDGVTNYRNGETIIFVQQEQFINGGPYDGWVDYSSSYIGDNIETGIVEGFDSGSYDTYTVIPGFLEKSQATSDTNYRGGVWEISITNGIVNLIFVQEIAVNDRVRVLFGKTLSSAVLIYSLDFEVGKTVPYYKVFASTPTIRVRTTFNKDTTKFFTYRDQYYESGEQDKYVKFPQYGVFN